MLAAYIEESVDLSGDNLLAMGAWLAEEEAWLDFNVRWGIILRDSKWPSSVSRYKASDCEKGNNEFNEWSKDQRSDMTNQMIDLLNDLNVRGVQVTVNLAESMKMLGRANMTPYVMAAQYCLVEIARMCPSDKKVDFIFDQGMKGFGKAKTLGGLYRDCKEFEAGERIGKIETDSSVERLQLQAADRLAYDTLGKGLNLLFSQSEPTPVLDKMHRYGLILHSHFINRHNLQHMFLKERRRLE